MRKAGKPSLRMYPVMTKLKLLELKTSYRHWSYWFALSVRLPTSEVSGGRGCRPFRRHKYRMDLVLGGEDLWDLLRAETVIYPIDLAIMVG